MVLPIADLGDGPERPRLKEIDYSLALNKPVTGHIEVQTSTNGRRSNGRNKRRKLHGGAEVIEAEGDDMDEADGDADEMDNVTGDRIISDISLGGDNLDDISVSKREPSTETPPNIGGTLTDKADAKAFAYVFKTGVPALQMSGHTGYLTFATLYPQ